MLMTTTRTIMIVSSGLTVMMQIEAFSALLEKIQTALASHLYLYVTLLQSREMIIS